MHKALPARTVLLAGLMLAATAVHAQSKAGSQVLPVWDKKSGQVEALLVLEPIETSARKPFSKAALDASFGLSGGDQLGLVCGPGRLSGSIGALVGNCLVAAVDVDGRTSRNGAVSASAARSGSRVGVAFTQRDQSLPAWLMAGSPQARVNTNALTLMGERNVGREATVSIGGTLARARLVSPSAATGLQDRWDMQALTIGARFGRFSANVVGRVVDTAADQRFGGVDLGFSWRTPWSGQLSIGAENVVTRGRNPFSRPSTEDDEAAVPYVRYQQDL